MSKIKVADIAYAISRSSASITGAIAAIADPPQIPVPADIKLESFQLRPSAFPIKYPPPKQVSKVKNITANESEPTVSIVWMLREAPSNIIANFSIFFDVNFKPSFKMEVSKSVLSIIPMNKAITEPPIRWIGSKPSINCAATAIISATATPGMIFFVFSIAFIIFLFSFMFFST